MNDTPKTHKANGLWTARRVREELPDVQVMFRKLGVPCYIHCVVRGRKNRFATVRPFHIGSWSVSWEFAWDTIAHSMNTGEALRGE